jgi:antitoxin (DNA-binding transcriptional repressor) of toxin-antitoxin stability system
VNVTPQNSRTSVAAGKMELYNVHMKQVTASDARKNWFRILDEVASGQIVVVERHGRRIVIQRQSERPARGGAPDYATALRTTEADNADTWGWTWRESGALRPTRRRKR